MLIKKAKEGEDFKIILLSSNENPKKEPVRVLYCFAVPDRDLSRTKYNLLAEIIFGDFPGLTDDNLWTLDWDFCAAYSFTVLYEEFKEVLKKYGCEDMLD